MPLLFITKKARGTGQVLEIPTAPAVTPNTIVNLVSTDLTISTSQSIKFRD